MTPVDDTANSSDLADLLRRSKTSFDLTESSDQESLYLLVVDLWGGKADPKSNRSWERDTLVNVFSTTKGVSSVALAHAHSRDWFDYDEKVATYWPEFAANGKENVTVRQLRSHQAGLSAIDKRWT